MKCAHCHKLGLTLSALLHLGMVAAFFVVQAEIAAPPATEKAVPVTLVMFQAPPPPPEPEPIAEPVAAPPPPEPIPEPLPEPVPEPPIPEPVPEPVPEPIAEPPPKPAVKAEAPKPKAKKPKKAERKAEPRPPVKEPPPPEVVASAPPSPSAPPPAAPLEAPPAPPVAVDPKERERYLARLIGHIERHKFYPALARRRGMQGTVKVSFLLLENGGISDLAVNGGQTVLENAAAEAMRKAAPLPRPPASLDCPHRVQFGMEFRLD